MNLWPGEPLTITSPLPVAEARERLAAGRISYLRAAVAMSGGDRVVIGKVGDRRVSLQAARRGTRNSWRPVLRGRLEPAGTGSVLTGTLGVYPVVQIFSLLWLGLVGCVFLIAAATVVVAAATGHGGTAGSATVVALITLVMTLIGYTLITRGTRAGRDDAEYLRAWLAERLR